MSVMPSEDNAGRVSLNPVFTPGPKFTGVDQVSDVVSRADTHKSRRPIPAHVRRAGPVRIKEHLESIRPNRWTEVVLRRAEFGDQEGGPERTVGSKLTAVDVNAPNPWPAAREKEIGNPDVVVLKVSRTEIAKCAVDTRAEVHRWLPAEVVARMGTPGHPDVEAAGTSWTGRREKQKVPIARESRRAFVEARIDVRSQIQGFAPGVVPRGAPRDPENPRLRRGPDGLRRNRG